MIVHDSALNVYLDVRRNVTGYGDTPEEAARNADEAEAAITERAAKAKIKRWKETVNELYRRMLQAH